MAGIDTAYNYYLSTYGKQSASRWGKVCYIRLAMEVGLFFMPKIRKQVEVEVVRTRITLACTECKQRNYNTTKDKKTHPDRMETKKYCRFCRTHTLHKETK